MYREELVIITEFARDVRQSYYCQSIVICRIVLSSMPLFMSKGKIKAITLASNKLCTCENKIKGFFSCYGFKNICEGNNH